MKSHTHKGSTESDENILNMIDFWEMKVQKAEEKGNKAEAIKAEKMHTYWQRLWNRRRGGIIDD